MEKAASGFIIVLLLFIYSSARIKALVIPVTSRRKEKRRLTTSWFSSPKKDSSLLESSRQLPSEIVDSLRRPSERSSGSSFAATKEPIVKAPLIDSTLLRFLSAQKDRISLQSPSSASTDFVDCASSTYNDSSIFYQRANLPAIQNDDDETWKAYIQGKKNGHLGLSNRCLESTQEDIAEAITTTTATITTATSDIGSRTNSLLELSGDLYPPESVGSSRGDTTADCISWFSQFNAHRIAQSLISIGAEGIDASTAGLAVQNHVLAQITRRSVRKFLRERSALWKTSRDMSLDSINQRNYEICNLYDDAVQLGDRYDVEAVIHLLAEDYELTGKDITAILTHTPSVAMMRANTSRVNDTASFTNTIAVNHTIASCTNKLATVTLKDTMECVYCGLLCDDLKLRKYDARKVLRSCPGLLTKEGSTTAKDVVSIFSSLGVSGTSLGRDKTALTLLLSRPSHLLFRLVTFLCSDAVKMPIDSIGPLIRRADCSELLDSVAPTHNYWTNCYENLSENDNIRVHPVRALSLDSLLGKKTAFAVRRIDECYKNMASVASLLTKDVGIRNISKVLSAYPSTLLLDADSHIIPVLHYLNKLGIDEDDVPRIIESYPALLGLNVTNMDEVVQYLLSLEVSEDVLGNIVRAFPSLLTLSVTEKMVPVVDFLRSIGVSNIGRFVTRLPPILGYSVAEELVPKWTYLTEVCQYASFEVIRFPAYFSYPLERVIMNRYGYLREIKRLPIQLLPVDEVLRYGDVDFATLIAKDDDGGLGYRAFVASQSGLKRHSFQTKDNIQKRSRNRILRHR